MTHKQWKTDGSRLGILILPLFLLACGLLINGCESDSVAPNDSPPKLTEMEVAQQAALVSVAISKVGPQLLTFNGLKAAPTEDGVYPYSFPEGGEIIGTIVLEYFSGGAPPAGVHSNWAGADYGLLYTGGGTVVGVTLGLGVELELAFGLTFNLHGDIDRVADTANLSGAGSIIIGSYTNNFTITEGNPVVLSGVDSFPSSGTLLFSAGGLDLVVVYDGSNIAVVTIEGVLAYTIDLNSGTVTPV